MLEFQAIRFVCRTIWGGGLIFALNIMGAEDNGGISFDPNSFLGSGVVGLIVIAFFTDRIYTAKAYNQMKTERDEAEARNQELIKQQFDIVLPLLQRQQEIVIPLLERVAEHFEATEG